MAEVKKSLIKFPGMKTVMSEVKSTLDGIRGRLDIVTEMTKFKTQLY